MVHQSGSYRVCQRSQALLQAHHGKSRQQIAYLLALKADTVTRGQGFTIPGFLSADHPLQAYSYSGPTRGQDFIRFVDD